jgi:phosphatidylcholine synthase
MEPSDLRDPVTRARWGRKTRAYLVHVLTATGVAFAFLAMTEVASADPRPRWAFGWLAIAVLIDAADGPLARLWNVKLYAGRIYGGLIDNIVDYLTFTFIPLMLVWRMDWLPGPDALWVVGAMMASLFGFSNTTAKQAEAGFFLGFPSYWNIVAYYVGLLVTGYGAVGRAVALGAVVLFAVLTVLPVRFLYPNQAPAPWRTPLIGGALVWLGLLVAMLPTFPHRPAWGGHWLFGLSLVYPAFYFGLSGWVDWKERTTSEAAPNAAPRMSD